jgi:VCBS repeat-containing protein
MDSSGNTGSLTIQADGSANLVIRSGSGQALVTENANAAGQLTIQFPDGTSQSVANIDMVDPAGILLV